MFFSSTHQTTGQSTSKNTMEITIVIPEGLAPDILQNAALSLGLREVTDEQVKERLGKDFAKNVIQLAKDGVLKRKRSEESSQMEKALDQILVK